MVFVVEYEFEARDIDILNYRNFRSRRHWGNLYLRTLIIILTYFCGTHFNLSNSRLPTGFVGKDGFPFV